MEGQKIPPEVAKEMLKEFEATIESVGWKYFEKGYEQAVFTARLDILRGLESVGLRDERGRSMISSSDELAAKVRYRQGFYEGIDALRNIKEVVLAALKANIKPDSEGEVLSNG